MAALARPIEERRSDLAISRSDFVLESTTDSVLVLDRDWRILYRNKHALELLKGRDLSLGRSLWDAFPEALEGPFHQQYKFAMAHQTPVEFEEFLASMDTWFEVHAYPSPDAITLFFRDVTERRRIREQLTYLAQHDFLTGLYNRPCLRERLQDALAIDAVGMHGAVLYIDLDQFKEVNDSSGHPFGDAVLKQVAQRLRECAGKDAIVGRIGGDEFVLVRSNLRSTADAAILAEAVIEAISAPLTVENRLVEIGASIGIALWPTDAARPDDLLQKADIALYRAKSDRGTYRFFAPEMAESVKSRQELKMALAHALERGELELVYQPIFHIRSGRLVRFEALLRWRHPRRGIVMPGEFIPLAEETGLIVPIGEWVLKSACAEAGRWPADVGVAVNLSAAQFRSSLPLMVSQTLGHAGLMPDRLLVEITESVLFQSTAINMKILNQLRTLGVRVALDDFGTGYSSLGYLREFPFHEIKVDRSFVADESAEALSIIDSVTKLGHALGAEVTAEGIEAHVQYERISTVGCDNAQGFLLGRPCSEYNLLESLFATNETERCCRKISKVAQV